MYLTYHYENWKLRDGKALIDLCVNKFGVTLLLQWLLHFVGAARCVTSHMVGSQYGTNGQRP